MNERYKTLWFEAAELESDPSWEGQTKFMAKFAELIVLDCIEVIVRNEHASLNISNFTDEKAQGIQLGLEFATIDIAEHFGVEE
jgi:hypothetical protein